MDKLPRTFPVLDYPREVYDYLVSGKEIVIENDSLINDDVLNRCPGIVHYVKTLRPSNRIRAIIRNPASIRKLGQDNLTEKELIECVKGNVKVMEHIVQTETIVLAFFDKYRPERLRMPIDTLVNIRTPLIEKRLAERKILTEPYEWDDEEYCVTLVNNYPENITKIVEPSKAIIISAVKQKATLAKEIIIPDIFRLDVIRANPSCIIHLGVTTEEEQLVAVSRNPAIFSMINNPYRSVEQLCFELNPYKWMDCSTNKPKDMCINAWERCKEVIDIMPDEYITEEMIHKSLDSNVHMPYKLHLIRDDDMIVKLLVIDSGRDALLPHLDNAPKIRMRHFRQAMSKIEDPGFYIGCCDLPKKKYQKLAEIIVDKYPEQFYYLKEEHCEDYFTLCAKAIQGGYQGYITIENIDREKVEYLSTLSDKVLIKDERMEIDERWKSVVDQNPRGLFAFHPNRNNGISYEKYDEIVLYALRKVLGK